MEKDLSTLRHSTSHVMASAVQMLFPNAKLGTGPAIQDGFYYDFDVPETFSDEDVKAIEKKMLEIIKQDHAFEREEWSKADAIKFFTDRGDNFKCEVIEKIPGDMVGIFKTGEFVDLCRGPHVDTTKEIKAFKLLSVAGAYWRGSEKNPMLKRIYGTAFHSKEDLKEHLRKLEEAKKRDHRKLGKELELFDFFPQIGSGLVVWFPKGALVKDLIETYWKKSHIAADYQLVSTPHIGKAELWETSGHLEFYEDSMYAPMDLEGQAYYVKPMNCPFHIMIYNAKLHSYRELPMKYAELGTVYRRELSGALHGLMRVRGFTQDDAHIICTPEQVEDEVRKTVDLAIKTLTDFGLDTFEIFVSTKPKEKSIGEEAHWEKATSALKLALEKNELAYQIDEGGGAFYGPKIDIKVCDAIDRKWQCSTIQFDFNLPERFDMSYIDNSGNAQRPYVIHRALFGSIERFIGTLIEHYSGAFPVWIAPVQLILIPVSEKFIEAVKELAKKCSAKGIRVLVDERDEKMGWKIRDAEKKKMPYMGVVGEKELEEGTVSLRQRGKIDLGVKKLEEVIELILGENPEI